MLLELSRITLQVESMDKHWLTHVGNEDGILLKRQVRNNLMHMQPRYYRARQVEYAGPLGSMLKQKNNFSCLTWLNIN